MRAAKPQNDAGMMGSVGKSSLAGPTQSDLAAPGMFVRRGTIVANAARPPKWKLTRHMWIGWSCIGLLAAALTELFIRTPPLPERGATIVATILVSSLVCTVGVVLIRRHRPA
jgi:hypothetical protein